MDGRPARPSGPLRRQIVRRFLLVALLPLLLLGAIGSVQTYLFVSAQAQATQSELASRVGREVQQHIAGLVADIELFALASDLTRQDARHQQAALATLLAALSAAEEISVWHVRDRTGSSVSRNTLSDSHPKQDHEWDALFAAASTTRQTQVGHFGSADWQGEPRLSLAIPLIDLRTGDATHILTVRQRLRPIWDMMRQESQRSDQSVYLVGPERTVLAH